MSTERNYNLEFCEGLLKHPKLKEGKELRYFDLLVVAESIVGEELWRIEGALLEAAKGLAEDEWENLNQLIEDSKKKHTKEILSIVERVARAFNPSANEERIKTVIQNAIKTSKLNKIAQENEVNTKPEPLKKEEHVEPPKVEVVPQAIPNPNIETLKKYLNLVIKLIPVYDSGAFVKEEKSSKPLRDWGTDNVGEIQSLINGYGYRNGIGKGSKISLFRLIPGDYGLVVIDIDRHTNEKGELNKDGLQNWRKIETNLDLPQDCKLENHTCYVRTPSGGYHLYYKTEGEVEFKTELMAAIDILYTKAVNTAGSVKAGKRYQLVGSLDTIPSLPATLKKLMLKEPVRMVQQPTKIVDFPYSFSTENGYLSDEERAAYKPYVREYLELSGHPIKNEKTNCPFTKQHKKDDEKPSAQVNETFLYCHKGNKDYDIFAIAEELKRQRFQKRCCRYKK